MQRRQRNPSLLRNGFLPCARVLAATSDLIVVPADPSSCGLAIIGQKREGMRKSRTPSQGDAGRPWVARETS
jgi:hypothetical protein